MINHVIVARARLSTKLVSTVSGLYVVSLESCSGLFDYMFAGPI